MWVWRTYTQIEDLLRFGQSNTIALKVNDWGNDGGLWRAVELKRGVSMEPYRHLLPEPILDEAPDLVELYCQDSP